MRLPVTRAVAPVRAALVALLSGIGLLAGACGQDASSSASTSTGTADGVAGQVTVSAAASLQEAFTAIAEGFETANPDAEVTINLGSSGDLATQIRSGAPADVAAFAAESDMRSLDDDGLLDGGYEIFATNQMVIVTKPGNPKQIEGLSGLATAAASGSTISLCVDTAPCGKYANEVLATAGVTIPTDRLTRGQDVRATLAAVTEGDADAAIVYVTDATAAGSAVDTVEIPAAENAVAKYPISVVKDTTDPDASSAFKEFVLGPEAQQLLADAGFGVP